jgi:hypothetical protein
MSETSFPPPHGAEPDAVMPYHVTIFVLTLAFIVLCVFQTVQLVSDREALANLRHSQEPSIQEGSRLSSWPMKAMPAPR